MRIETANLVLSNFDQLYVDDHQLVWGVKLWLNNCHNNYQKKFLLQKPSIQIAGRQNIQHNYHHCQIVFKACFCCNGGGGLENDQTGLTILSNFPAVFRYISSLRSLSWSSAPQLTSVKINMSRIESGWSVCAPRRKRK